MFGFNRFKYSVLVFFLCTAALSAESFIAYMEGETTVTRDSSVLAGEIGFSLLKGDKIETGSDSLAVLELEDRGTLKLREDTSIVLSDLGDQISVSLSVGGLFSRIRRLAGRGYGVRTPNVSAAVRGTEFFVAYGKVIEDEPDVWLCVNEGTVEVALENTGDSVLVNEGEGINILSSNRITDPRFFPWTEDLNWNTDPDSGDVKDVTDLDGAYADLRAFDYD
jgi:ferric-dicitrate binding protein FerR (iron transport regulator)